MALSFSWKRGFYSKSEAFSIDKMALWGQGSSGGVGEIYAGLDVNQSTALRLVTVYACVRMIADDIAALPADVFRRVPNGDRQFVPRQPPWLLSPNPETTWFEFVERILSCLLLDGNAFIIITARDAQGFPAELWTLNPRTVEIRRDRGRTVFIWNGDTSNPLSRFGPTSPMGDILHIKDFNDGGLRGLSPIDVARQAIGLGLVAEKFGAKYFGGDQDPKGLIELPVMPEAQSQKATEKLQAMWSERHGGSDNAHRVGVLAGGAHFNMLQIPNDQAQFLDTRKFQVEQIASLYGVPPYKLGRTEPGAVSYASVEQQAIDYVQRITPRVVRIESSFNQLTPRGQFIKWNLNGLLRGDMAARAAFYREMVDAGIMLRSEPRSLEDLPAVPGIDKPLLKSGFQVLDENGDPPAAPAPVAAPAGDMTPNMPTDGTSNG